MRNPANAAHGARARSRLKRSAAAPSVIRREVLVRSVQPIGRSLEGKLTFRENNDPRFRALARGDRCPKRLYWLPERPVEAPRALRLITQPLGAAHSIDRCYFAPATVRFRPGRPKRGRCMGGRYVPSVEGFAGECWRFTPCALGARSRSWRRPRPAQRPPRSSAGFSDNVVISGLTGPTAVQFPDGRISLRRGQADLLVLRRRLEKCCRLSRGRRRVGQGLVGLALPRPFKRPLNLRLVHLRRPTRTHCPVWNDACSTPPEH